MQGESDLRSIDAHAAVANPSVNSRFLLKAYATRMSEFMEREDVAHSFITKPLGRELLDDIAILANEILSVNLGKELVYSVESLLDDTDSFKTLLRLFFELQTGGWIFEVLVERLDIFVRVLLSSGLKTLGQLRAKHDGVIELWGRSILEVGVSENSRGSHDQKWEGCVEQKISDMGGVCVLSSYSLSIL
jgi:hypothetical protein